MLRPTAFLSILAAMILAAGCNPPGGGGSKSEPKLDSDDSKAIYALGLLIAERIDQFGLSESELDVFQAGVRDGVLKREHKVEPKDIAKEMQAFAKARQTAAVDKEKADSAAFLVKMAAEPGATTAPSGYIIRTITEGTGASPTATDTVKVNYHGTLRDGTVFDSTRERGEPAIFPVGGVIPCWTQSLQTMKVGGKYQVTCPSDIAYGDRGAPPSIKPGAALSFEVELLDIEKPPAEPSTPPAAEPAKPAPKGKKK